MLQQFNFNGRGLDVIYDNDNMPLFHANTVCNILGFSNLRDALARHVDVEDVCKTDTLT